jgi:hypothetical protein
MMKSRIRSALVPFGALAAASLVSASAPAQSTAPSPALAPTPAPTGPTLYPSTPYRYQMGEQRAELMKPNPVLLTTGGLTLIGAYAPAVVIAASSDHDGDKWLYAPVIGPWIDLASRGCDNVRTTTCGVSGFERAALIGSGVLQVIGVAEILGAFTTPARRLVTAHASDRLTMQIVPATFGPRTSGLAAFGTF